MGRGRPSDKSIDSDAFRTALLKTDLCDAEKRPTTSDEYFDRYDRVLRTLADEFAPVLRLGRRRQRLAQWMDAECFRLRRQSRRLEKHYRRSQAEGDRLEWILHERKRHDTYRPKEFAYRNLRLSADASSSKKLWRTLGSLMGSYKSKQPSKSRPTAQQLLDFFNAKVDAVRQSTGNLQAQSTLQPSPIILL